MTDLLPNTESVCERVLEAARPGARVYVEGPVGAGRNSLVSALTASSTNPVVIELLPMVESDSPAVALLDIASQLAPNEPWPTWSTGAEGELHEIARRVGESLASSNRLMVMRMPDSWSGAEGAESGSDAVPSRARSLLSGLFQSRVTAVLVADAAVTPARLGFHPTRRFQLPAHSTGLSALDDVAWGSYFKAFEQLRGALHRQTGSPLAWRLAVGARVLGADIRSLDSCMSSAVPLPKLTDLLVDGLRVNASLKTALLNFMAIRRPIARADAVELSQIDPEHAPLVLECVGYGTSETRVSTVLRSLLTKKLGSAIPAVHAGFAHHYTKADGAASPLGLGNVQLHAWCEKVHHLAHSGMTDESVWADLDLVSPSFYWDRARHLSLEIRDYAAAARVYQACVDRFPEDDYAWHYLGFNLERAYGFSAQSRRAFSQAVSLNPEHPWWNSRLVTNLIGSGCAKEAEIEWRNAVERVDPEGIQVRSSPWLAHHLHLWVSRAWLKAGRLARARAVLDLVPRMFTARPPLSTHKRLLEAGTLTWTRFLENVEERCGLSSRHAAEVRKFWRVLEQHTAIPLPMADTTADRCAFQFAWSYSNVLLEIEVSESGDVYWYGKDRFNGESDDGSARADDPLSEKLKSWLTRISDV